MILRSTDKAPEITPIDGMAWHYVWELLEFGACGMSRTLSATIAESFTLASGA